MIKKLLFGLLAICILLAGFVLFKMMQPPPDDLDLRTERQSDNGLYVVSFLPIDGEPKTGPIHAWNASVKDNGGDPVTGGKVLLDGGMPQHGHGLPTSPKMTDEISPGVYKIDGVKFSMSGWWEFKLKIEAEPGNDSVTFNVVLE